MLKVTPPKNGVLMPLSSVVGAQSIVKPGVCTSSTRPASPYVGQCIYETDTLLAKVWDGSTWADYPEGKLTATTANTSGRNLLINGDFKVWQRGNARTYMNAGSFLADRWCPILYQNAAYQRVAGRATQYAIRVSSSSTAEAGAGTRMWLVQKVESLNSYRLRNQQVTLSFWVRFSAATATSSTATPYGNWTAGIGYYTSTTDSATGTTADNTGTNLVLTNGSLPTTWTKYSVTGTCPSNLNNIHAKFGFSDVGNTASNSGVWYEIAEVQLEVGAVATPFEFEDYGTTLAKCQRYYQIGAQFTVFTNTSTSCTVWGHLLSQMRVTPTVSATGPLNLQGDGGNNNTQSSVSIGTSYSSPVSVYLLGVANFTGLITGRTITISVPGSNGNYFTFNSEL